MLLRQGIIVYVQYEFEGQFLEHLKLVSKAYYMG